MEAGSPGHPAWAQEGQECAEAGVAAGRAARCGFFLGPRETGAQTEAPLARPPAHTLGPFFGVRLSSWRPRTPPGALNSIRSWHRAASCPGKVRARARLCAPPRGPAGRGPWAEGSDETREAAPGFPGTGGPSGGPPRGARTDTWRECVRNVRGCVALETGSGFKPSRPNMPLNLKARTFCKIIQKVC